MFQVTADTDKNRLYVTLQGHLEANERAEVVNAFIGAIRKLQPGFDIINDMSALAPTEADGLKDLARVQATAMLRGVRKVIRVVRIPLSRIQLDRLAKETGWAYEVADSVAEAEAILDALGPAEDRPG